MIFFYSFLIFLFGASLGSFANVCIHRLPKDKQIISGRSYCPECKKKINWYDNLPLVSYILLNAKCRNCNKSISVRYLIVELITGISFLLIFLSFKNLNTVGKNDDTYKSSPELDLVTLFDMNISMPLIKEEKRFTNYLTPKISLRYKPSPQPG